MFGIKFLCLISLLIIGSTRAQVSQLGSSFARGYPDGHIGVFDIKSLQHLYDLNGHTDLINSLAKLDDNKLLSGSSDNTAKVWDLNTQKEIYTLTGHTGAVTHAAALNNGRCATGSLDSTVKVWDLSNGELKCTLQHKGPIKSIKPIGKNFLSASLDSTAVLWDIDTCKAIFTFSHDKAIEEIAKFDDKTLFTASDDGTVKIWSLENGTLEGTLTGHNGPVITMLFMNDNTQLATGSQDGTVKIWDLKTNSIISTLVGHTKQVNTICPINDKYLASGGMDGLVIVWDMYAQQIKLNFDYKKPVFYLKVDKASKSLLVNNPKSATTMNNDQMIKISELIDDLAYSKAV